MKIKLKTKIKNNEKTVEEEINAIYQEEKNKINYLEENSTKVEFDITKMLLKRENKELKMEYDFSKRKAKIYIKDLDRYMDILLDVKNLKQEEAKIEIEYIIEEQTFIYSIEWRNI